MCGERFSSVEAAVLRTTSITAPSDANRLDVFKVKARKLISSLSALHSLPSRHCRACSTFCRLVLYPSFCSRASNALAVTNHKKCRMSSSTLTSAQRRCRKYTFGSIIKNAVTREPVNAAAAANMHLVGGEVCAVLRAFLLQIFKNALTIE